MKSVLTWNIQTYAKKVALLYATGRILMHLKPGLRLVWCVGLCLWFLGFAGKGNVMAASAAHDASIAVHAHTAPDALQGLRTLLVGWGDSLTHGTMDATNNACNTRHAYLQRIAESIGQVTALAFSQPFFDDQEERLRPFLVPTNLGVDGADIFSIEGVQYYKRVGADESFVTASYLCEKLFPSQLEDKYDKVLYPMNLLSQRPVSQIASGIWLLNQHALRTDAGKALAIFWMGNNDSGLAALGFGGENPTFLPIPLDQIEPEIKPALRLLLRLGESQGDLSFAPYTSTAIERNLTELQDFEAQYERIQTRLQTEVILPPSRMALFVLTLPYYNATGYLFDSEDLEYYLQKLNPDYTVPATFERVALPGEPITEPLKGDRVSLLTFGFMYALLHSGYSIDYVNQILEVDGQQQDGLVLSQQEQQQIMSRIDAFNNAIKSSTAYGSQAHLVDIGQYFNDAFTGKTPIIIDDRVLSRKWVRGSGFSLDGVHPGYTVQALVANFVLAQLNDILGLGAPLHDLSGYLGTGRLCRSGRRWLGPWPGL